MNVGSIMEMHSIRRNVGPMVVVVNESSKSSPYDDDEKRDEQVKNHLIANEEEIKIPAENAGRNGDSVRNYDILKRNIVYPAHRVVEESHFTPTR